MPDRFNISANFEDGYREVVEEAVKKSNLPEGVNVIQGSEISEAKKPFVVIAWATDWEEAREAFKAGALDYVPASMNADELARRLSS